MTKTGLLIILGLFLLFNSIVSANASKRTIVDIALSQFLYKDPQWLALGHYQETDNNKWLSEIDDLNFFLSKEGKTSPEKELTASINELKKVTDIAGVNQFKCKYPARYHFINRKLKHSLTNNFSECTALNKWLNKYSADSTSIIYPSSYLSNPSSIFGHTFLRFDRKDRENNLSYSVDFSAKTPPNENIFSYIKNGLTGSYKGIFSIRPYYIKSWKYSDIENRKLWEYKLKLTRNDTQLILLHLWELRGKYTDYYFVDENCSYQILSLLAIVSPDLEFREDFTTMTIPSDTIRFLYKKNYISSVSYLPSPIEQFELLTNKLPAEKINLIKDLTNNKITFDKLENTEGNKVILQAATNLLFHKIQTRSMNQKYALNLINKINKKRIKTLKTTPHYNYFISPVRIEESHSSSRIGIALINLGNIDYLEYSFRGAYHSFDDILGGFFKGTEIKALDFSLIQKNSGDTYLNNFTLLSLTSIIPDTFYTKKISWDFELARKRLFIDPVGQLIDQINIGLGKAASLSGIYVYLLANTGITYNSINGSDISLNTGYKGGLLLQNHNLSAQLEFIASNLNSLDTYRYKDIGLDISMPIFKDMAIKLSTHHINSKFYRLNSYKLGLSYYF